MEGPANGQEPVAIVGMAVRFPGADDVHNLWDALKDGLNTATEIPNTRFDVSSFSDASRTSRRRLNARHGNFINDIAAFDNNFFHISPREARSMDPQQRLLLEVSYHALEDAGYVPNATPSFDPNTFGTFVGATTSDYLHNLRDEIDVYYSTGTISAFLSGRISYTFGFCGPSMVVDTTCSSSVVAIHQACRALGTGDCNAAIAGGVNVITSPDMHIGLDRAHFLSPTGQCRPWDASADGYCRAEGCGMFVLKRLSDAIAENDNILGVIRSIEVNQSANADSITHPHVPTQIDLFKKVLASANVLAEDVSVVEAHGTGTQAGDPAELESIRAVLAHNRSADNPLHVTSVKANLGHAESASGAASLAKLLLMFQKSMIPPTVSLKTLNPRIPPLGKDYVVIDTSACSWAKGDRKRFALLNNFGASGSNAALLLEEPPVVSIVPFKIPLCLVGLSADTREALEALRASYIVALNQKPHDDQFLADLSYTSMARRKLYRYRLSVSGRSCTELIRKLETASVLDVTTQSEKTVFVCSGQGSQYLGMGGSLYHSVEKFRGIVDECHSKLLSWGLPGILHILLPNDYSEISAKDSLQSFQTAIFVVEYAIATLWISWGVLLDAAVGHSLGEYVALTISGVLTLQDALRVVAERARLITEHCEAYLNGMLAVHMSPEEIASVLESNSGYSGLEIACFNSPTDCVVAGNKTHLGALERELKHSDQVCRMLDVPFAYHTPQLSAIQDPLLELTSRLTFSPPTIPVFSNVHGQFVSPGDSSVFTPEYLVRHSVSSVRFNSCSEKAKNVEDLGGTTIRWIEIGPHPITLPILRSSTSDKSSTYYPSLRKDTEDVHTLLSTLSQFYETSSTINWQAVFADLLPHARPIQLPAYPFSKRNQFFVPFKEGSTSNAHTDVILQPPSKRYTLSSVCVDLATKLDETPIVFESQLDNVAELIDGHHIAGYALCPASVYMEAVYAAVYSILSMLEQELGNRVISFSDLLFTNPLIRHPELPTYLRTAITITKNDTTVSGHFQVTSSVRSSHSDSQLHCKGLFKARLADTSTEKLAQGRSIMDRRISTINADTKSEIFRTRTIYETIFPPAVVYTSLYQSLQSVAIHSNGIDSYAEVLLPENDVKAIFALNPVFLDTLVHLAGFVINLKAARDHLFICDRIGKVEILSSTTDWTVGYHVYCSVDSFSDNQASATVLVGTFNRNECDNIVARMKGIRFKRLKINTLATSLSRIYPRSTGVFVRGGDVEQDVSSADITLVEDTFSTADSHTSLETLITGTIGSVLEIPTSDLPTDTPLSQFGLDSLASIEVLDALQTALNISLPEDCLVGDVRIFDVINLVRSTSLTTPHLGISSLKPMVTKINTRQYIVGDVISKTTKAFASVLGMDPNELSDDDELIRYGLDSLAVIEARYELEKSLNITFPTELLQTSKTLRDVQDVLVTLVEASRCPPSSIFSYTGPGPVQLQDGDPSLSPLFLIHDGSGLVASYAHLHSLGRRVYGIFNPRFGSTDPWKGGILGMASTYASMIEDMNDRSCILGGWSIGGVIAFEISRLLIRNGRRVDGLILVDAPSPDTSEPLPEALIDTITIHPSFQSTSAHRLEAHMRLAGHALATYDRRRSTAAGIEPPSGVILRCRDGVDFGDHKDLSITWLVDRRETSTITSPWENVLGSITVIDVGGNHFTAFHDEHIPEMTAALKDAIAMLESP